jgi:hypothetical protein
VIERGRNPRRGVVTQFARLWESSLHMIGIGGTGVGAQVTGNASGRQPLINAAGMATTATQRGVKSRQRESRLAVVKLCPCP